MAGERVVVGPRGIPSDELAPGVPGMVERVDSAGRWVEVDFPTAGHYAAYNGTAPVEFSSAGRTVHRLSRRGNRTLNHAIHMAAVTQMFW